MMTNDTKYEIYIGCNDTSTKEENISNDEIIKTINNYFSKKKINYSLELGDGGYLHNDGRFIFEKTIRINIIGSQSLDIIDYAKKLAMYMNQECLMITKEKSLFEYR